MTPNDDQTPRTSSTPTPSPHSLDDQLPPSLFDPPGRGSPPPLFGPAVDRTPTPDRERAPRPAAEPGPTSEPDAKPVPASASEPGPDAKPGPDAGLPPLFGRADRDPAEAGKVPPAPPRAGSPEPPNVSLHLGSAPDRRTTGPAPAAADDGRAGDARAGERPASGRPAPAGRSAGPTPTPPAHGRPPPGGPGG
ncbi:membrane protease subunit, partial [Streptomyces anulatus]